MSNTGDSQLHIADWRDNWEQTHYLPPLGSTLEITADKLYVACATTRTKASNVIDMWRCIWTPNTTLELVGQIPVRIVGEVMNA